MNIFILNICLTLLEKKSKVVSLGLCLNTVKRFLFFISETTFAIQEHSVLKHNSTSMLIETVTKKYLSLKYFPVTHNILYKRENHDKNDNTRKSSILNQILDEQECFRFPVRISRYNSFPSHFILFYFFFIL